jgi:hypothetical protein
MAKAKYRALKNFELGDGRKEPSIKKGDVIEVDFEFAEAHLEPKGLVEDADPSTPLSSAASEAAKAAKAAKAGKGAKAKDDEDDDKKGGKKGK